MVAHQAPRLPSLYRLRLRASNCYLVIGDGAVLIDSGLREEGRSILNALERKGVRPADLNLVLLTHGHLDHAGAACEVAAATGAPIALHAEDARWVSSGQEVPAPPITKWARVISHLLSVGFVKGRIALPLFSTDIVLGDTEFSLRKYGIPATVLHTPGHTAGSVSVLLEDGRAIVGDLVMNGLPSLRLKPTPPIVAQDLSKLARSWRLLCDRGATTVYPGHGSPFPSRSIQMKT